MWCCRSCMSARTIRPRGTCRLRETPGRTGRSSSATAACPTTICSTSISVSPTRTRASGWASTVWAWGPRNSSLTPPAVWPVPGSTTPSSTNRSPNSRPLHADPRGTDRASGGPASTSAASPSNINAPCAISTNAARNAMPYMDVVTTSGPGTGKAAAPEKIRTIRQAIGDKPLAIASGVTPENVPDYLPVGRLLPRRHRHQLHLRRTRPRPRPRPRPGRALVAALKRTLEARCEDLSPLSRRERGAGGNPEGVKQPTGRAGSPLSLQKRGVGG